MKGVSLNSYSSRLSFFKANHWPSSIWSPTRSHPVKDWMGFNDTRSISCSLSTKRKVNHISNLRSITKQAFVDVIPNGPVESLNALIGMGPLTCPLACLSTCLFNRSFACPFNCSLTVTCWRNFRQISLASTRSFITALSTRLFTRPLSCSLAPLSWSFARSLTRSWDCRKVRSLISQLRAVLNHGATTTRQFGLCAPN